MSPFRWEQCVVIPLPAWSHWWLPRKRLQVPDHSLSGCLDLRLPLWPQHLLFLLLVFFLSFSSMMGSLNFVQSEILFTHTSHCLLHRTGLMWHGTEGRTHLWYLHRVAQNKKGFQLAGSTHCRLVEVHNPWCPHPRLTEQILFGIRSVVMLDLETALKVMEWQQSPSGLEMTYLIYAPESQNQNVMPLSHREPERSI